jgi:Protein-tyrosine phosphatase
MGPESEDMDWLDETGLMALPGGARVRGRRLADPASPADFALVLAGGPSPGWPHRRVRWPDFGVPTDRDDALDALRKAHRWAYGGERVEVACRSGLGRTGTALAALVILDGLTPDQAVAWVRDRYDQGAIETPWQRRWLRNVH